VSIHLPMRTFILFYVGAGVAACFLHPAIRTALSGIAGHKPKGLEVIGKPIGLVCVFLLAVAIWPIAVIRCKSLFDNYENVREKLDPWGRFP